MKVYGLAAGDEIAVPSEISEVGLQKLIPAFANNQKAAFEAAFGGLRLVREPGLSSVNSIANRQNLTTKNPAFLRNFEDSTSQGISKFATVISSIVNGYNLSSVSVDSHWTLELGGVAPPGSWWQTWMPPFGSPRVNSVYQNQTRESIFWDQIVSIQFLGNERVYDISVEGTHNFIGNDIFAHNTYLTGGLGVGRATTSAGVIETTGVINVQGAGTSTFANGITLTNGCFFMPSGLCAGSAGSGGAVNTGTANRLAYYSGTGSIDSANFLTTDITNSRLGLATATPATTFSIAGNTYLDSNVITFASSSAASLTLAFQKSATSTIPAAVNAFSLATSITGTPILSIDGANGRVGIGTAAPGSLLHLEGAGGATILIKRTDSTQANGVIRFKGSDDVTDGQISYNDDVSGAFTFNTGGTNTRMTIGSTGNVGIGTTTPAAKLSINAASNALGFYLAGYANSTADMFRISSSTASATSTAFIIDANGKVGIGTPSPSQQLSI